ncbi:BCCT family transporter [Photobacterium leiognathi]|uniref:BCCT family transporter n=1 Tax=Photobacterium leiognathi TaxID=553611 RepID=UPI00298265DE|nr:BCCT family transporter [Photobacterium leiognathi]
MNTSTDKVSSKYSIETTDYQVGQDNIQRWGFDIHKPVFGISALLILIFIIVMLVVDPQSAKTTLNNMRNGILEQFDSYFMWTMNMFFVFCVLLMVSPLGKIRIGGKDAKPEHSTISWSAMLFAAGLASGVMFFGVAEPAALYTDWYGTPFNAVGYSPEAKQLAIATSFFHWGITGWSVYGIAALALAFFAYNKNLPLSIRSLLFPIFGDRVWGWLGNVVDILAVVSTLFGLVASLGLGAQQAVSGINYVFGTHGELGMQFGIIAGVTSVAIFSVVRGIEGGVKLLSNINIVFVVGLLIFVAALNIETVIHVLPQGVMDYVKNFVALSNPIGRTDTTFLHGWTIFYWAWWISFTPFVGIFIARVSKGRTVRQFIFSVLVIPTCVIICWFSVFGGIAVEQLANKVGQLGMNGLQDISLTLFYVYDAMPMSMLLSVVSIVLILVFFVTSSDSASLVIDSITAGGKLDAPVPQRIFWATIEGVIAAILLWVGGSQALEALQSGVVITALPFSFILVFTCVSLIKGLNSERHLYR